MLHNTDERACIKTYSDLNQILKKDKECKTLIVHVFAGQSYQVGPNQTLLINRFDQRNRFYKRFFAEAGVRALAARNPNSYNVALFACNKENAKRY